MHRDLAAQHPGRVVAHGEQPLGQGLDQIDRLAGDDGGQPLGQHAVVGGELQVVAGRIVDLERGVDDELLALAALVVEDAVKSPLAQPVKADLSHARPVFGETPDDLRPHASPGRGDPHRVGAGAYLMDPDRPGALGGRQRRRGDGRSVTAVDGPGMAGGVRQQRSQEGFAAGAHEQRPAELLEAVERGEQCPVVLGILGEADARIQDEGIGSDPGGWAACSRAPSSAQTSATTSE